MIAVPQKAGAYWVKTEGREDWNAVAIVRSEDGYCFKDRVIGLDGWTPLDPIIEWGPRIMDPEEAMDAIIDQAEMETETVPTVTIALDQAEKEPCSPQ